MKMKNKEVDDIIKYIDRILETIRSSKYSFILSDYIYFISEIREQVEGLKDE